MTNWEKRDKIYTMQLYNKLRWHTWMVYVPGQTAFLDVPDVVSLSAPNPCSTS